MPTPYSPYPPSISARSSSAPLRSASPSHLLVSEPKPHFLSQDTAKITHFSSSSGQVSSTANKKKHVCNICAKAFTTSGHLSRHARIHTGERNHKCPFPGCDTRCSRQDNLQQHYRIHLTPGSRRNSTSARSHVLSGIKNHVKVPPVPETLTDSPPSTPPALELAFVPRVYSASEPSPPLSTLPILYPPTQEYVKQDYQDATTPSPYFDPRGSPRRAFDARCASAPEQLTSPSTCPSAAMDGLRHDSCDNPSSDEHSPFNHQNHIYPPSSGALVITESHAINDMSSAVTYGMYGAYAPPTHPPPPNRVPLTQSSDTPLHTDVSIVQPQPRSNQPLTSNVPSNQAHISPVPSSNSPSPVSSLSMSSHSSEHSSSLYQKHDYNMATVNGLTYSLPGPPQSTQIETEYVATTHYHSSQLIPTESIYGRGVATAPWENSLSDTRGIPGAHGKAFGLFCDLRAL
ncbi:hypothetical protein B0F90DRAFT_1686153 [Multifurca ochricompacta]|uniref:C2H2-type domain-containing protein n=1 Tax=Multifurca ochricompacta TaxID=376703 RepID=A0AAD4QPS7_9AGAM|nr:hypothetical protein B0F90DRAFT_1686153 [Multifurca ochricompacta]